MKRRSRSNPSCKRPTYWGRGGAGMMFICTEDATVLLLLRASWVMQGGTWGVAGGGIEEGYVNTPIQDPILDDARYLKAAVKETEEECGSLPPGFRMTQVVGQTEYEDCGFRYVTFVADITKAQKTAWKLDSSDGETDAFRWVPLARVKPGAVIDGHALHFGVEFTLTHPEYARIVQGEVRAVANPRLRKVVAAAQGRRARRNEGAPVFRDLAFEPIPNIPDSKRVSLDFKNGYVLHVLGALGKPNEGDGVTTWAVIVDPYEEPREVFKQQTGKQVEDLLAAYATKPPSDVYLRRKDPAAYQLRLEARKREAEDAEALRKAKEKSARKQLATRAFRKWFGDSQVVDAKGKPLVVYHGTNKDFTAFRAQSKSINTGLFGVQLEVERTGIFLSDNPEFSKQYGKRVLKLYASIQNPARLTRDLILDFAATLSYQGEEREMRLAVQYAPASWTWEWFDDDLGRRFVAFLRDQGYDGAVFEESLETEDGGSVSGRTFVAFDAEQVKSATDNIGTFDPKNPDIRHNPRNRRARRNEGAPAFRDLAFEPIPKIPDSKRVSLDFKNGHYLTIAGAPSFPDQGDGTSTWALQVTEGGRSYSLMQQTREQVEALIARLAAKPATDDYLQRHDYPAYQERLRVRHAEAEGKRKAAEDAAHKALMTPKFRKWFGKSKVVDKQGRPLKVYHGSREAGFHAFDTSSQVKPGFFFTNDVAMARSYTPRNTDVQLPYFRTLKEVLAFEETSEFPLNLEKKDGGYDVYFDGSYLGFYGRGETKDMLAEINSQSTSYPGVYEVYLRIEDPFEVDGNGDNWDSITITDDDGDAQTLTTNDISNMAQDMGHDGVIIRDVTDAGGHGRGSESGDVYIAFDPNQIKSTQNIGSYSRDTDDLRLNPRKPRKARKARSSRRGR